MRKPAETEEEKGGEEEVQLKVEAQMAEKLGDQDATSRRR